MLNEDEYLNVNCKNFSQKFVQFVAIVSLITFDTFVFMNTMFMERFGKICINPRILLNLDFFLDEIKNNNY